MGRRRAGNWKSLFSGVWRAEFRREVTVGNAVPGCALWNAGIQGHS